MAAATAVATGVGPVSVAWSGVGEGSNRTCAVAVGTAGLRVEVGGTSTAAPGRKNQDRLVESVLKNSISISATLVFPLRLG